ncbi:hypothetical protein ACFE04_030505 [Oxalis oulophora]
MESSSNKLGSKCLEEEEEEESGWTSYFEYFSQQNKIKYDDEDQEESCNNSLVSDADSCVPWKLSQNKNIPSFSSSIPININTPKKLRFKKKTRTNEILFNEDDSLEDTASSPVNSPKVSNLEEIFRRQKKFEGDHHTAANTSLGGKDSAIDNISSLDQGKTRDCTELKRRGLCLVPMSMLVDYLG